MPADLAGTAVLAELYSQYRSTYPEEAPARSSRRLMRLGADEESDAERPVPRRPRSAPGSEDGPEYGDRTLLR